MVAPALECSVPHRNSPWGTQKCQPTEDTPEQLTVFFFLGCTPWGTQKCQPTEDTPRTADCFLLGCRMHAVPPPRHSCVWAAPHMLKDALGRWAPRSSHPRDAMEPLQGRPPVLTRPKVGAGHDTAWCCASACGPNLTRRKAHCWYRVDRHHAAPGHPTPGTSSGALISPDSPGKLVSGSVGNGVPHHALRGKPRPTSKKRIAGPAVSKLTVLEYVWSLLIYSLATKS